jgi:uncharacterized protein (TIGR02246 family)
VKTDALAEAKSILRALQAAVDARDADALVALFDDRAVLIGGAGDGRDAEGLRRYLTAVATQADALRWEWSDVVPFLQESRRLGFAAFGDIVLSQGRTERRAPIRVTVVAVGSPDGWRLHHFHGSIPSDF